MIVPVLLRKEIYEVTAEWKEYFVIFIELNIRRQDLFAQVPTCTDISGCFPVRILWEFHAGPQGGSWLLFNLQILSTNLYQKDK